MALPDVAPPFSALQVDFEVLSFEERAQFQGTLTPVDAQGRYLPWDEVRYRKAPNGLTRRQWWLSLATARRAARNELPLLGRGGQAFWFCETGPLPGFLKRWDAAVSSHNVHRDLGLQDAERNQLRVSSQMYESIQSSRLEGANTTREVALEMLRDGRRPRDYGERMIANNYAAMELISKWTTEQEPFDIDHILEVHRVVTDGTLRADDVGRLQNPGDPRVYVVSRGGEIVHTPPPASELPERMQRLCDFENQLPEASDLHHLLKAILVHFMIGYDHPFADGNGRTARALFYWSLLRSGIWLSQYLPISEFLLAAPGQYSRAYQFVHADGNDVTHFLLHQLDVVERSVERLDSHVRGIRSWMEDAREATGLESGLNQRQSDLLAELLNDPTRYITIARYRRTNDVSYAVSHGDLADLVKRGLLERERVGRRLQFRAAPGFQERLGG
ncbi:MAG: Fic family protein [Chloroflexi bacterium]|nr:Fic family protein [Chloroflexota bacterium]MCY3589571.1 Fic family protein [Chloroflexota bacterium]MCY3685859.1 Fic family protein [Chloroflexota bacterium]MDE2709627.1 Fic family protein [Chloroflexota bacterium]